MANDAKGAQSRADETIQAETSLLDQVLSQTRSRNDEQRQESRRQITTLVEEVMQGQVRLSKDLEATINARIADIDQLLTRQLNEILHQPEFQKLEASWRGLHYVVQQSETSTMFKIPVLNATKGDLVRDLERPLELGQRRLSEKL